MNVAESKRQIQLVSSQDKNWTINYLASQSSGLARLVCEEREPRHFHKNKEVIEIARFLRAELLRRFGLVLFGSYMIMNQDGSCYESDEVLVN